MRDDLQAACDAILIENMPRGLREAIDDMLIQGYAKRDLLRRIRQLTGGRRSMVFLACEAYLSRPSARSGETKPA